MSIGSRQPLFTGSNAIIIVAMGMFLLLLMHQFDGHGDFPHATELYIGIFLCIVVAIIVANKCFGQLRRMHSIDLACKFDDYYTAGEMRAAGRRLLLLVMQERFSFHVFFAAVCLALSGKISNRGYVFASQYAIEIIRAHSDSYDERRQIKLFKFISIFLLVSGSVLFALKVLQYILPSSPSATAPSSTTPSTP